MRKVLLAVLVSVVAFGGGYKPLKALGKFSAKDFHLKEGVDYMEIRMYSGDGDTVDTKKAYLEVQAGSRVLSSFDPQLVKRFKAIKPMINGADIRKSMMCLMMGCVSRVSNGFAIHSDGKQVRMNETRDVVDYLGDIDTPAELKLVLWLNDNMRDKEDNQMSDRYAVTGNGYKVIYTYENTLANMGECGVFTQEITVSRKGKVSAKKAVKTKESKHCVFAD